ncbi:unnamed protein product [Pleuronectes platessa]|uniref:Uncharacterized protein n=1 Tax=Pleuronectes platessa TaxID=8262 RepID=A0A9N7UG07_PLEPL|nr:unnamed protein product [Pleuronectes platessa]
MNSLSSADHRAETLTPLFFSIYIIIIIIFIIIIIIFIFIIVFIIFIFITVVVVSDSLCCLEGNRLSLVHCSSSPGGSAHWLRPLAPAEVMWPRGRLRRLQSGTCHLCCRPARWLVENRADELHRKERERLPVSCCCADV